METKKVFAVLMDITISHNFEQDEFDCDIAGLYTSRKKAWDKIMEMVSKDKEEGEVLHSYGFKSLGTWTVKYKDNKGGTRKINYTIYDDMTIE